MGCRKKKKKKKRPYRALDTHHEHGEEHTPREDHHHWHRHGVPRPALPHRILAHEATGDIVLLLSPPELRSRLLLLLEV